MNEIPFVDLKLQYENHKEDFDRAIADVLSQTAFIGGEPVRAFEDAFAKYCQAKYVIPCANGTDAIEILLRCLGVKPGDEVIVPALTWISTSEAVSSVGARPVFADIIEETYTIDPKDVETKITSKTKVIIPVHLYGCPANMPQIMDLAARHGLKVLEDCAQAHGAQIDGKRVGTFGNCASFSFYPGKNLGAWGDAGAMVTNDEAIAMQARRIANHGQLSKHDHQIEGRNSRLDGLQAAVLSAKLPHLEAWTERRRENAKIYATHLDQASVQVPVEPTGYRHVNHLYVVRVEDRDGLRASLTEHGIGSGIHYPTALPFLPCYASRDYSEADFPVAYRVTREIVSLPMFAELSEEQVVRVCRAVHAFCK